MRYILSATIFVLVSLVPATADAQGVNKPTSDHRDGSSAPVQPKEEPKQEEERKKTRETDKREEQVNLIRQRYMRCKKLASTDRLVEVPKVAQQLEDAANQIRNDKTDPCANVVAVVSESARALLNLKERLRASSSDAKTILDVRSRLEIIVKQLKGYTFVESENVSDLSKGDKTTTDEPATFVLAVRRLNGVLNALSEMLETKDFVDLAEQSRGIHLVGDNLVRLFERDVASVIRSRQREKLAGVTEAIAKRAESFRNEAKREDYEAAMRSLTLLEESISALAALVTVVPGAATHKTPVFRDVVPNAFNCRVAPRDMILLEGGGSSATEATVLSALSWLARHQANDGRWDSDGFPAECGRVVKGSCVGPGYPEYDTGVTSMSLLAFLGAGYTHLSSDVYDGICFGTVVKKGTQWLMTNQDREGCIGGRNATKYMYNHAIAALALSEAYGMTTAELLKEPAQRAINFLINAQNPGLAWRYTARCGDNDTSVTGWAVMALKSAEISGLQVPSSGYEGTKAWLNQVTGADHSVGYNAKDTGQVVVEGLNEHFANHEALAAIAVMSRIFMGKNRGDPALKGGVGLLLKDLPVWNGPKIDYYYWYNASMALFQFDGPSGPSWKAWNEKMKNALVANQKRAADGCQNGSWDPIDRWGFEGGRVYATAINALTLETYYRYTVDLPVHPRDRIMSLPAEKQNAFREYVEQANECYDKAIAHLKRSDQSTNPEGWQRENKSAYDQFARAYDLYNRALDVYNDSSLWDRVKDTNFKRVMCRKRIMDPPTAQPVSSPDETKTVSDDERMLDQARESFELQKKCSQWLSLAKNFFNMKNYDKAEEYLQRVLKAYSEGMKEYSEIAEEAKELLKRVQAMKDPPALSR